MTCKEFACQKTLTKHRNALEKENHCSSRAPCLIRESKYNSGSGSGSIPAHLRARAQPQVLFRAKHQARAHSRAQAYTRNNKLIGLGLNSRLRLGLNSGLPSSVGNGDINFATPLFQVVFPLYLARCFFRTIDISDIPMLW